MNANRRQAPYVDLSLLSDAQKTSLNDLKTFGWSIAFVRKPIFHPPLAFVIHEKNNSMMVLRPDGSYEPVTGISFRKDDQLPQAPLAPDPIDTSALDKAGLALAFGASQEPGSAETQKHSGPAGAAFELEPLQKRLGLGGDDGVVTPSHEGQHHTNRYPK